ncbi:Na+/H+ antiporter subunit A [Janibacter alkaliphilus]|uniref:Multicomponent Na+:H+ antiporter subunit A n=1 Tax=Janibacter alkaliphilus TaxID=1069963 RepID=A0A852XEZ3_9MICO|nr:multicomponent Na+:H+ antiporter subunit A [Janibacter alkaliphilus]
MTALLLLHLVAAGAAPALVRVLDRRTFLALALVPAASFAWLLTQAPAVLDGDPVDQRVAWVPSLDLALDLRLGALQLVLALVVTGVGSVVLAYSAWYFSATDRSLWRFTSVFTAFAGAMLGLVLADNLLALYVFWELTSVTSYLLIGHNPVRSANRRAATQALLVTTLGGLAMLVGLVILGESSSYTISRLLADPPAPGALTTTAVLLVLLGALTKSAQIPFHFWLPGAMAAPTPVSAYLHAASMVKAGVYLVALLAPIAAATPGWRALTIGLGVWTMLLGGWRALRQHDIKLLLAFGTVSQLGMLTAVAGLGTTAAAQAALALLVAHALFKSALFLVVGIIDKATGTRDMHQLSGLGRRAPLLTATAVLAGASMAGLPPLLGFVAKESALAAGLDAATGGHGSVSGLGDGGDPALWGWVLTAGLTLGAMLTVAYTARFLWGALGPERTVAGDPIVTGFAAPTAIQVGPAVLAALGLLGGFAGPLLTEAFAGYVATLGGAEPEHLALWHGLTPALGLSALAVAAGLLLFAARDLVGQAQQRVPALVDAESGYTHLIRNLDRLAVETTAVAQRGSLPGHLGTILVVVILGPGLVALTALPGAQVHLWDEPGQLAIGVVVVVAALLATRARDRLQTAVLVGVTGYGVALLFLVHGAPDLALTQVLVETVSLVVLVLVLRNLPAQVPRRPLPISRSWRALLAAAAGAVTGVLLLVSASARTAAPVSQRFPQEAYDFGHGQNVVNVTLVDIRAWDTLGEISVVVAAATGVASLVFVRMRDTPARPSQRRAAAVAAAERNPLAPARRSVILETVTRLLFHVMIALSLYLVLAGHNQVGGGFAGGLTAGLALLVRYLAGGRFELDRAAPVDAGLLLGGGLAISVLAAVAPLLLGGAVLESSVLEVWLPVYADVKVVSALVFDIGVYLVVVGLALDIVRSLGGGIDAHREIDEREQEAAR